MGGLQKGRISAVEARDSVQKMTGIFGAGRNLRKEQNLGVWCVGREAACNGCLFLCRQSLLGAGC